MGVLMELKERERLHKLLSKLFEDLLSDEEAILLEQMLEGDEEARLMYMQYVDLQVELGCLVVEEHMRNKLIQFPGSQKLPSVKKVGWRRFAEAAVLVFGLGLGLLWWFGREGNDPAAQIAQVQDIQGDVILDASDADPTPLLEGMEIAYQPGDVLRTEGEAVRQTCYSQMGPW